MHVIPLKTVGIVRVRSRADGRLRPASASRKLPLKMGEVVRVVQAALLALAPSLL